MRVLLIEDDQALSLGVRRMPSSVKAGVSTCWPTAAGVDGRPGSANTTWPCWTSGLPGCDGMEVLRHWRSRGARLPVLLLTARDELSDRVEGLDAGADDFLAKPFDMPELLARLRALRRRAAGRIDQRLVLGGTGTRRRRTRTALCAASAWR
jgi:two-component system OmpR family response regulator